MERFRHFTRAHRGNAPGKSLYGERSGFKVGLRKAFDSVRPQYWTREASKIVAERRSILAKARANPGKARQILSAYRKSAVRGADIYSRSVLVNGKRVNNLARMKAGKPPLDKGGRSYHLHHKLALQHGGTNALGNLIPARARIHEVYKRIMHAKNDK